MRILIELDNGIPVVTQWTHDDDKGGGIWGLEFDEPEPPTIIVFDHDTPDGVEPADFLIPDSDALVTPEAFETYYDKMETAYFQEVMGA